MCEGRSHRVCFAVALLAAVAATTLADPPRPRVLFVVGATGTMNSSLVDGAALGGDGSESYPGDGEIAGTPHVNCPGYPNPIVSPGGLDYNCSRLFQTKQALRDALIASPPGTGLMRFDQNEAVSQGELLSFFTGFYDSTNNPSTATNFSGAGCGSYDFNNGNFWSGVRGSVEAHTEGGDLLVEAPLSDELDTRDHVAGWLDHLERWWLGGNPGNLDFATWSEVATLDDGGYALSSFINKDLRSVTDYSVTVSALHEAWAYMKWLRSQDPFGEERRYLVFAVFDGIDGCSHDSNELDVYWDLKAPPIQCQERFAMTDCPAIELYPVWMGNAVGPAQLVDMTNFAWSGSAAGTALSQNRYLATPLATDIGDWIRAILIDVDKVQVFSNGLETGSTSAWSLVGP